MTEFICHCQASWAKIHQAKILWQGHINAFEKMVRWRIVNVLEEHQQLQKKKSMTFVRAKAAQVFELLQLLDQFHEQQHIKSSLNISH